MAGRAHPRNKSASIRTGDHVGRAHKENYRSSTVVHEKDILASYQLSCIAETKQRLLCFRL
jgi:hypothetical protein